MSSAAAAQDVTAFENLLPQLTLGAGAERSAAGVTAMPGPTGHVVHGPKWPLKSGSYLASFFISGEARWTDRNTCVLVVEAVDGDTFLGQYGICGRDVENGVFDMPFKVPGTTASAIELRVWTWGLIRAEITRVSVMRRAA